MCQGIIFIDLEIKHRRERVLRQQSIPLALSTVVDSVLELSADFFVLEAEVAQKRSLNAH